MMSNNYLYLYPDTFFFNGKSKMLLYNTVNYKILEIKSDPVLTDLQNYLMQLENSYCIQLDESLFLQYKSLWDEIMNEGFGDIVCTSSSREKPVSYPPVLKINRDIDSIRYDYGKKRAGYILQYLNEVTVYLCGNNKYVTAEYYKQTTYPVLSNDKLSENRVIKLVESTKGGALKVINLLGDPQILSGYTNLFQILKNRDIHVNFYILHENFVKDKNIAEIIPPDFNIVILYERASLKEINPFYDATCFITNEFDIKEVEQFLSGDKNKAKRVELIPIYTGENLHFFEENVLITKAEVLSSKLSKQDIFIRMALNINYFGKLIVLPDGNIYSNVNCPPLGTIDNSLYELIYKELNEAIAWCNVRNKEPCIQCQFRWICPPISNYEFVINQYNLCTVSPNNFTMTGKAIQ